MEAWSAAAERFLMHRDDIWLLAQAGRQTNRTQNQNLGHSAMTMFGNQNWRKKQLKELD